MKKLISTILSAVMLVSAAPGYIAFAEEQPITIDSITVDMPDKTARVEGTVNEGVGARTVTLRVLEKGTELSAITKEDIQNIAQTETDRNGKFTYEFEMNFDGVTDIAKNFDVYATNGITGDTCSDSFSTIIYNNLFENAVVMYKDNLNVIKYGERAVLNSAPYVENGKAYLNASEVNKLFGTNLSGVVDLTNFGNYSVYYDDGVLAVSKKEIAANVGALYRDFGIYVSTDGDDTNNGRFESPVKTLDRALELAENFKGFDGAHIYIKDGNYNFGHSVEIENKKNITIENYAGGNVSVNGKIKLAKENFQKTTDESILSRVGEKAKGNLYSLDLSNYISGDLKKPADSQDSYYKLYADGNRQTLARYPDAEYSIAREVESTGTFTFPENERISQWNTKDAYVVLFNDTYTIYKRAITSFNDGAFTVKQWSPKNKLCAAVNILEELTVPGEWYIDSDTKMLYYYPERGLANIELTTGDYNIINISGSENITVKGIKVGKANGTGINATNSDGIVIDNVKLHNLGIRGVTITDSANCTVKNSTIFDTNNGGVYLSGGDIPSLTPGNNTVENCHIYDFSQEATNEGGVILAGMGNSVKHNVIHDSTSQGVFMKSNSNGMLIENNEIYNVVRGLFDAGAVYGINFLENTGIQIKNNYIHDLSKSYMNWGGIYAIYSDNGSSGITVENNIVSDSLSAGLVGGGRDNTWNNNLFIDSNVGAYDTRMTIGGWIRGHDTFETASFKRLMKNPEYDVEKWKAAYPFWDGLLKDLAKEKAYLDSKTTDENGSVSYDESIKFDAGLPWNVTITNNLTIADKKSFNMNPVGVWWNPKTAGYNTTYKNNVSVMGKMYQDASVSGEKAHNGEKAMKYEIKQSANTAIKKQLGSNAKPGEIYKISAWIYADKVADTAKVKISTDNNPTNLTHYRDFPFTVEGNGEVNIPAGEWVQIYCYWVSNDNNNSAVISFPQCSVGDIFYIDDVKAEKVMYSEQMLPTPSLNDIYTATTYKYESAKLDLSETKSVLKTGDETEIKASVITAETTDNDGDGIISGDELKFNAQTVQIDSAVSDNTAAAEIVGGKIKAVASGNAKITVNDVNGNTASMYVTVVSDNESVYGFNGTDGYVKDNDPIYNGEVLRPYSESSKQTDITAQPGMTFSYKYFDSGLLSNNNNGSVSAGFQFGNDRRAITISDRWIPGQYEITNTGGRRKRYAGWHQVTGMLDDSGKLTWYHDGVKLCTVAVTNGEKISIVASMPVNGLPTYIKEVYMTIPESGKDFIPETAQSYVLDDFESDNLLWTTDQIDKLQKIYADNKGESTDVFKSWFEDFDNRNFEQTAELFKYMPQFQRIEFASIGNSAADYDTELEMPVERLAKVNAADKTVQLIWSSISGASAYRVEISRTANMRDIVYKNRLDTNTDTAWIPESGTYYYTVTAMNLSKNYKAEQKSNVYSFTVSGGVSFDKYIESEANGKKAVSFIFNSDKAQLAGKAILAEKDKNGKLINTVIGDIPAAVDGKITISGECENANILECYLWNGVESMVPYCAKATYNK